MTTNVAGAESVSADRLLQIALGFWPAKTLLSAVELGLFTELGRGPLDEKTLAERLGLHPRSARDFFDALVSMKLLDRHGHVYTNTAETDALLDRNKPGYIGGMFEMANARLYGMWGLLTEALRTGESQSEAKDDPKVFEKLYADPVRLEQFLSAMTGISRGPAEAIAAKFPWERHQSVVDVGCAQGIVPVVLARAHPHLTVAGFDLPQVRPVFEKFALQQGVGDRLQFHAGNFFSDPLPSADAIVMGHILHDWNLEQKRMLLAKAYEALPAGGAVIVYEALIDDERRTNTTGLLMSLNMLLETPGGFDYTGADCQGWMRDAGFRETRVEHLVGPDAMVVGIK